MSYARVRIRDNVAEYGDDPRMLAASHRHDPLFVISVAAELADMHPQTLRQYDRLGLVTPRRQGGRHRRYSPMTLSSCGRSNSSAKRASH